jgi:hypothetical protein
MGLNRQHYSFWCELLKSMLKMFYKQSKANPCLFFKQNQEKEWVDDLLMVGKALRHDEAVRM